MELLWRQEGVLARNAVSVGRDTRAVDSGQPCAVKERREIEDIGLMEMAPRRWLWVCCCHGRGSRTRSTKLVVSA